MQLVRLLGKVYIFRIVEFMRRLSLYSLCFLFFIALQSALFAQREEKGAPLFQYFPAEEYKGSEQNWAFVQDARGMVYVGNNEDGVLEYDGERWRQIPVANGTIVRALALGSTGIVYVGVVGDFGRLLPDSVGQLRYVSLLPLLPDSIGAFADVYKVYSLDNFIYFCTRSLIFCYDEFLGTLSLIRLPSPNLFLSFCVDSEILVGTLSDSIFRISGRQFSVTPIAREPRGGTQNIYGIVPFRGDTLLLGLYPGRLMFLSRSTGRLFSPPDDWWVLPRRVLDLGAVPYSMHSLSGGNIGVGLIFSDDVGYVELRRDGGVEMSMGVSSGLKDAYVMDFGETSDGTLWLMQNEGITKVERQSLLRRFDENHGISGAILDVQRFDGRLYIATMNGLQYLDFSDGVGRFKPIEEIASSVWKLMRFYNPLRGRYVLLALGVHDLYEVSGSHARPVVRSERISVGGYDMCRSSSDARTLYIARPEGVSSMRMNDAGRWEQYKTIAPDLIRAEIRHVIHDDNSILWCATYSNGVYAARQKPDGEWAVRHIDLETGLPSLRNIFLVKLDGRVQLGTLEGVKYYDWPRDTVLPSSHEVLVGDGVTHFTAVDNQIITQRYHATNDAYRLELIRQLPSGNLESDAVPFSRLPKRWCDAIRADEDGSFWLAYSSTLYNYSLTSTRDYSLPFRAFVRSAVITREDSLLFGGTFYEVQPDGTVSILEDQPETQRYIIPYAQNALLFTVGSDFYEGDGVEYSVRLKNSEEQWSKWDRKSEFTYNNLFEGTYVLQVKARNMYGVVSNTAEFTFTVRPPFYRTWWAYTIGILALVGAVWGITVLNTRRIVAEKMRLEKIVEERTLEVVQQKERIEKQNEEIVSSITYASKIQQAVLPTQEAMTSIFPDHFLLFLPRDVVSGDFYWMVQIGDKKVCAIADCTGHGVPGGFMSMLGTTFLHQIVRSKQTLQTDVILNELRDSVIKSLHQTDKIGSNKDGMDIALYILDETRMELEFSGANNPLIIVRGGELEQYRADKMPIGIYLKGDIPFSRELIKLEKGDMLYTFSDGYPDQFGGPQNRKFMIKNLKTLFVEIAQLPLAEQREVLLSRLLEWQGDLPRTDDVIVFGVRV